MTKQEYVKLIKQIRKLMDSGKHDKCTCPKTKCEWHSDCFHCVMQHRAFGDHVPNCMQFILSKKIEALAGTAELEVKRKPMTKSSYWDYVRKVAPRKKPYKTQKRP